MPLKITNPSKEAAVLNRWADVIETKLRKIETHPLIKAGFVNTTHSNFPTLYYQTEQQTGTDVVQRSKNNFLSPLTAVDDFGNDSTNIGLGIVPLAKGGTNADLSATGGTSRVLKQVTTGATITVAQLAASDLSNGTTGSGSVVLNGTPSLTTPAIGSGGFTLAGSSSGTQTIKAAAATSGTITLPAGSTDFSATGGTSQVLKQVSTGAAITVAQLAASDLSNGTIGSGAVVLATAPVLTTLTLTTATPTVTGGQVGFGTTTSATANTTGGGLTLPLLAAGYLVVNIGGTDFKLPYYAS